MTENGQSSEALQINDIGTVDTPETNGNSGFKTLQRKVRGRAAAIKSSLPWVQRTNLTSSNSSRGPGVAGQEIHQDSEKEEILASETAEFKDLEEQMTEADNETERDLQELNEEPALTPEQGASEDALSQKEAWAQARQRHSEVKAAKINRKRQRLRANAVAAGIAAGLVLAPQDVGHGDGVSGASEALATSIVQGHPSHAEELLTFYPEIAHDKHETIPIDANTTLFNFTDHEINPVGVRETFAFYKQLATFLRPTFLRQTGKSFPVQFGGEEHRNFQGSMTQRDVRDRVIIIAPARDHADTSVFTQQVTHEKEKTADAYTVPTVIGAQDVPVSASYIYVPDSPNNPSQTTLLERFDIEACQSAIKGFSISDIILPDKINTNRYVQEGICNNLGQGLRAVQAGMSERDFIRIFASSNIPLRYDVYQVPTMSLDPSIYKVMKGIEPGVG